MTMAAGVSMMRTGYVPSANVFAQHSADRYAYVRVSDAEFARRWRKIREFMDTHGLDVLLIGGGTGTWDRCWTNTRWAVNHVGCQLTNYSYVVFSKNADPTVIAFPLNVTQPARRAREIVEDVRGALEAHPETVKRIREAGFAQGTIGIVEADLWTSIPARHMDYFRSELPQAQLRFVTREWWLQVRLVRSEEEIENMAHAAAIGDAMSAAVAEQIHPGNHERDVFAVMSDAMIRHNGEIPTMVLAASGPSNRAFDTFQRERHLDRVLADGDVILTEVAPRWPDGSECQTGRSYALGEVSQEYLEMADVMVRGYNAVVDQLRSGRTDRDVVRAGQLIREAGYMWLSPLIHGAEGGAAGSLPVIGAAVEVPEVESFAFQPSMVVCVEIHIGRPDQSAGLFMADTWVTTEGDPRPLNHYPREFVSIREA